MQYSILIRTSAVLLATIFLAACGQKGPLYLPGNPSEMQTEVPANDPEKVDTEDDEEDDYDFEPQSQ
jgi:predicted small lipoprotein YifL